MTGNILFISAFCLFTAIYAQNGYAKDNGKTNIPKYKELSKYPSPLIDTVPPTEIMDVITAVIRSTESFNIEAVANLYSPNAVISDDAPPYSWNGPTAGVQWVNAVEKVCKDNQLTRLKGKIEQVNVFQQNADNVYMVVAVSYTGNLPGGRHFAAKGAFTFVLRMINGKWIIKSQTWMPEKGINSSTEN